MEESILIIRIATALTMIVFGIHQFLNPSDWTDYIPDWLSKLMPFGKQTDMRMHAIGNIVIGLWFGLGFFPILATWVTFLWWVSILPFAFRKNWAIGMRDLTIIAGILAVLVMRS